MCFPGAWYYVIDKEGISADSPRLISEDWPNLPSDLDAAVFWPTKKAWYWNTDKRKWAKKNVFGDTFFFKVNIIN